jgi:hypothetical protein
MNVFEEGAHSKAFADNLAALIVPFGDGDEVGVRQRAIDFGKVLSHAAAADDGDAQLTAFLGFVRGGELQSLRAGGARGGGDRQRVQQEFAAVHEWASPLIEGRFAGDYLTSLALPVRL